jgi:hypothetical protein
MAVSYGLSLHVQSDMLPSARAIRLVIQLAHRLPALGNHVTCFYRFVTDTHVPDSGGVCSRACEESQHRYRVMQRRDGGRYRDLP